MSDFIAPTSPYAVAGSLNLDRLPPQGAVIEIQLDPVHAGEELTVVLAKADGTQLSSKRLPVNHNDQHITVRFASSLFSIDSGKLEVYYKVGNEKPSAALELEIRPGFSGEHTADLSERVAPLFYHNGVIKLPHALPSEMQFARPLQNATGYTSSDGSIATVDGAGNVSLLRNGRTTITATLADGTQQQYTLTVKGLTELEVLASSATFKGAGTLCKRVGMRLPSHADFALFKSTYGSQLGQWLPDLAMWGEAIGADSAWTFHPHTAVITGESSAAGIKRQVAGMI